jgi:hypothetical protein
VYVSAAKWTGSVDLATATQAQLEELLARMEAEMRTAGRNLEFERPAVLRDEIQQVRLRVLAEDASAVAARAVERAVAARDGSGTPARGRPAGRRSGVEVSGVTVEYDTLIWPHLGPE